MQAELQSKPSDSVTFARRWGAIARRSCLLLPIGLVSTVWVATTGHQKKLPLILEVFLLSLTFSVFLLGLLILINGLRGLPCVVATSTGVTFTTPLGSVKSAAWASLSEFIKARRLNGRSFDDAAVAQILGGQISESLGYDAEMVIHDEFQASIPEIVAELNRRRIAAINEGVISTSGNAA